MNSRDLNEVIQNEKKAKLNGKIVELNYGGPDIVGNMYVGIDGKIVEINAKDLERLDPQEIKEFEEEHGKPKSDSELLKEELEKMGFEKEQIANMVHGNDKEVEEPKDTTKEDEVKEQTEYSSIDKLSNEKLEELYQKTNKRKVPYYQTAKEALMNWNGLSEHEANEMIDNQSFDEIEGQVWAKGSMDYALENIANSLELSVSEYDDLKEAVYKGEKEDNHILNDLKSKIEEKGLDNNKVIMDTLFSVHDGWVKDNEKKFDTRQKNHQHVRSEFMGWKEAKSDLLFIKNIFESAGIDVNEEQLESEYNRRRDNIIYGYDITDEDKLAEFIANDEYYPIDSYSDENKAKMKNKEWVKENIVRDIKEKGMGDPTKISDEIKKSIEKEFQREIDHIEPTYEYLGDPVVKVTGNEVEDIVHSQYSEEIEAAEEDPQKRVEHLESGIVVVTDVEKNAETLKKEEAKSSSLKEKLSSLKEKFAEFSKRKKEKNEQTKEDPANPGE